MTRLYLKNWYTAVKLKLTDTVEGSPLDAGKLVLSPTRTYAPVVKKLLDALRPEIHGMVHCSGGAQTKVLHFVGDNCRVIKDNLFPVPPLFQYHQGAERYGLERNVQGIQYGTPPGSVPLSRTCQKR